MILGLLYKAMHKCELVVRPLTEGELIMPQFGQSPMLAKIESALAGLAQAYARLTLSPQAQVSDVANGPIPQLRPPIANGLTRHGFGSAANVRIPPITTSTRDPLCPLYVDSRRRSNVSNAQIAVIPRPCNWRVKSTFNQSGHWLQRLYFDR